MTRTIADPAPLKVRCADCGRQVTGRRVSEMRGGAWHPRPHKTAPNDGEPCEGHRKPAASLIIGHGSPGPSPTQGRNARRFRGEPDRCAT